MQFQIEQSVFLNAVLQAAVGLPGGNPPMPILSGFHIEAEGDAVTIRANSLSREVTTRAEATVSSPGKAVVNGKYLADLVKRLPPGPVKVEQKGRKVTITAGAGVYQLTGMDPNEFPAAQVVSGVSITLPQPLLRELIRRTASIPDGTEDESQIYRRAVSFVLRGTDLRVTATDGVRIAYLTTVVENPANAEFALNVPAKALKEFASSLSSRSGDVSLLVNEKGSAACFELGATRVWMRLLEGAYPDVLRLVPQQYARNARMATQGFIEALERAALVKDAVKLNFTQDACKIEAEADVGATHENVACKLSGDDLIIGFRPVLLVDGLKYLDQAEFTMEMNGPREPARIKATVEAGEGRTIEQTYIVLPLVAF